MTTGILGFILSIVLNCSPTIQKDTALPEMLRNIPIGIEVNHSKEIVYAEFNEKDPEKRGKYKWHYETTVKSTIEDLTIIEFGAYIWANKIWSQKTIYDRPFNKEEFAKWYSCSDGELIKGKEFTDFNNWNKGNTLDGKTHKTLWYFIGVNKSGEKYKGTAEIISVHKFEK